MFLLVKVMVIKKDYGLMCMLVIVGLILLGYFGFGLGVIILIMCIGV